jgi:hypothetical protein
LLYRDYKTRSPGEGELLDAALRRLRAFFPTMEYEDPFAKAKKDRTAELGGEAAVVLTFAGQDASGVPMRGQCYMLTRRGYGYWLFTWAPEDFVEELAGPWEKLRAKFTFLDDREGWKAQPRKTDKFRGTALPYTLAAATEIWRKEDNPKNTDAKAELVLRGFEAVENEETGSRRQDVYSGKAAEVHVLILDAAPNLQAAVALAQEHIRKNLVDLNPALKIEPARDRKTDKPLPPTTEVGSARGQVNKLRVALDPDNERYGLLAVVNKPTATLVIYCDCKWERRIYWDQEFKELLDSVQLR